MKGKYYVEPVYYADLPAICTGVYVPLYMGIQKPRCDWEPVPESALRSKPTILRYGTVIRVGDFIGRYKSLNINNRSWVVESLRTNVPFNNGEVPTIGSAGVDNPIRVLQEDVLGHCYTRELLDAIETQELLIHDGSLE